MYWRQTRPPLLAAGILAAAAVLARGQDAANPAPILAAGSCRPAWHPVCVKEWVPETYQRIRTVYHPEKRLETYTAYTCESVPYQATRTVCVYVPRQETVTCTLMVCHVQKQVSRATDCVTPCCWPR
jgi:hypothetical protein